MASVRATETKPEIIVRKFLFSKGFRYRKNDKSLPGSPDIVLNKYKTVIFVHGCFWHGHKDCKDTILPKSNKAYWEKKIESNINRDKRKEAELKKNAWRVLIIWTCQINKMFVINKTGLSEIERKIKRAKHL